jgi:hypothetical protein
MRNSGYYQIDLPQGLTPTGSEKIFLGPWQGESLSGTKREFAAYHEYSESGFSTSFFTTFYQRLSEVERKIDSIEPDVGLRLRRLNKYNLREPLDIIVQKDGSGFLASSIDLPLYGYGDDAGEAIEALKEEIENLYEELLEDDNFTRDWKRIKKFLCQVIDTDRE